MTASTCILQATRMVFSILHRLVASRTVAPFSGEANSKDTDSNSPPHMRKRSIAIIKQETSGHSNSTKATFVIIIALSIHLGVSLLLGKYLEGWSGLTSIYFAVVTLTTVGYGDVAPSTQAGRLVTAFYILYGVFLIGWAISSLTSIMAQRIENLRQQSEQKKQEGRRRIPHMLNVVLSIGFLLLIGVLFYCLGEDMDFIDSFYFAVVTLTTVGYGDIHVSDDKGKAFQIFYLTIGTVSMAKLIGDTIDHVLEAERQRHREAILRRRFTLNELFAADADKSGTLTETEFVVYKFQQMGLIKPQDLNQVLQQFANLDADNNGCVTFEEASECNLP